MHFCNFCENDTLAGELKKLFFKDKHPSRAIYYIKRGEYAIFESEKSGKGVPWPDGQFPFCLITNKTDLISKSEYISVDGFDIRCPARVLTPPLLGCFSHENALITIKQTNNTCYSYSYPLNSTHIVHTIPHLR